MPVIGVRVYLERLVRSAASRIRREAQVQFSQRLVSCHTPRAGHPPYSPSYRQRVVGLLSVQQETQPMEDVEAKRAAKGRMTAFEVSISITRQ